MKTLLVSDLHSQKSCLVLLRKIIEKHHPESLICAGDITQYDEIAYLEEFFSIIKENAIQGYLIWGSNDRESVQKKIVDSPYSIHLKQRMLGKYKIFGISEIEDIPIIEPENISGSILVTHRPPHLDSLKTVRPNAPKYHISGHVHHKGVKTVYPATILIQIPSLTLGRYGLFDPDSADVKYYTLKV